MEFIGKFVAWAATAGFRWVAALQHEAFDHAVEGHIVVVAAACEVEKIRAGERSLGRVEGGVDVASGRVNGDFDVGHVAIQHERRPLGNALHVLRDHPAVFGGDLFFDRSAKFVWQHAPGIGLDLEVRAGIGVRAEP